MINTNKKDNKRVKAPYRGKFISVVIQPKVDSTYWKQERDDKEIEKTLLDSKFPLWTGVLYAMRNVKAADVNKQLPRVPISWAYGSETSVETGIPHYQVYLEFDVLVKRTSVFESLDSIFKGNAHIATQVGYSTTLGDYCVKPTSNFNFSSKYYRNIKIRSDGVQVETNDLLKLRPKLRMIKDNYMTGQKLLEQIAYSKPDDRTGIWLADVIGGTGKTGFFQTIINDNQGLYLRISEGLERLSSKLRKKISARLSEGKGYPRFIWINFGRTLEEGALKAFSDFAEQILDGMLDDNFGNTGGSDFVGLPYVNLIVTANTPPNLKQLTGDRLKLLTLFPVYKDVETLELQDSFLIPIYVEIKVRIFGNVPNILQYRFRVKLQDDQYIKASFSHLPYYDQILENCQKYKEFLNSDKADSQYYQSRLQSDWYSSTPNRVQSDIFNVYAKAAFHAASLGEEGRAGRFIEASSFHQSKVEVHRYINRLDFESNDPSTNSGNSVFDMLSTTLPYGSIPEF